MTDAKDSPRISFWGLLEAAAVLVCIATTVGFFGRVSWLFDLACHFRVQYFLFLTGSVVLLAVSRKYKRSALFMLFASANLSVIVPLYFGAAGNVTTKDSSHRILILNVHTSNKQHTKVLQMVRRMKPDILLLSEVDRRWVEAIRELESDYPFSHAIPREDNFGIALYSRFPIVDFDAKRLTGGVPTCVARFSVDGRPLVFIGTHVLPPADRRRTAKRNDQIRELAAIVGSTEGARILAGDLNITSWSPFFQDLLQRTNLHDSRRGFGVQSSWPAKLPLLWIPIDHCLVSSEIAVHRRWVESNVGSDHFPIVVDFSLRTD